jgi:hypothetical protein
MTELNPQPDQESVAEFSLLDVIIVLLKYKKMIFFTVVISILGGMGLLFLLNQKNPGLPVSNILLHPAEGVYYSECLIEPEPGALQRINWMIYRRNFVLRMIQDNNLESDIQKAIQPENAVKTPSEEMGSMPEFYRWVRSNLFVTVSDKVLTIGFAAPQRELPPKMVFGFLKSISEYLRKLDMDRISVQKNGFDKELAKAQNPVLMAKISDELVELLKNEARTKSAKYYRFELIDPPTIVDKVRILRQGNDKKLESLEDWVSVPGPGSPDAHQKGSRYGLVFFLLLLASLVVAVSLAFFLESIEKSRQRSPEKIALLKRYASFRRK